MAEDSKQTSFRAPEKLLRRFKIVAARQGKSQNDIIVDLLTRYVDLKEKEG